MFVCAYCSTLGRNVNLPAWGVCVVQPVSIPHTQTSFHARQRQAYAAGKTAWREDRINAQALQLYEELVRRVGANAYCWIGEEALADELGRSTSTIKRWMRQLVAAHLIRRERQFGHTTHTYVSAYDQRDITNDEPPSFGSAPDPTIRSEVDPDPMKDQHLTPGGGGEDQAENATTLRLQDEGIADHAVLHELQDRSPDDVETVVRYVARCRERHDPRRPGLIVHFLRHPDRLPTCRPTPTLEASREKPVNVPERPTDVPERDVTFDATWTTVLEGLATQVPPEEWTTWLRPTALLDWDGSTAVIGAPNVFVRDELERFRPLIMTALGARLGRITHAEFVIGE